MEDLKYSNFFQCVLKMCVRCHNDKIALSVVSEIVLYEKRIMNAPFLMETIPMRKLYSILKLIISHWITRYPLAGSSLRVRVQESLGREATTEWSTWSTYTTPGGNDRSRFPTSKYPWSFRRLPSSSSLASFISFFLTYDLRHDGSA